MHVLELVRGLHDRAEIHVGSGEAGFLMDEAGALGVRTHAVPHLVMRLSPQHDLKAVGEIRGLIRRIKPDVVHLHSSKAGILGRAAAWREGVPFVFTAHGWAFTDGASWRRKLVAVPSEWMAARLRGHIICVSEYDYKLALRHRVAPASQMTVIHNGLTDNHLTAKPIQSNDNCIIMVARFAVPKDHALVVRAMSFIQQTDAILLLVGDGPLLEDCKALAHSLGVAHRIRFLGARNDVPELLAKAHVFVLASNYEGFPISTLEAMRAGLPVVISDVGGAQEAVTDGVTGYLFPKGDAHVLAQQLDCLLLSPDLRAKMGAAGRQKFLQEFTVERMIAKTEDVYHKIAGR